MKTKFIFIVGFLFLFFGCSKKKETLFLKKKEKYQPFIINLQHYFSEEEFNVSFPIWFNDSLIKLNNIKQISRSIYISRKESDMDIEFNTEPPKEIKTYSFNKKGELLSIQVQQFYENVEVGNIWFDYLSSKDENGYSIVERRRIKNQDIDGEHDHYKIYEKEEHNDKFLVYTNEQTGDYLFYILKRKNWGVISVDSILNPTPKDIIAFGTTFYPKKIYQVENTVNEFNVVKYSYDKTNQFIKKISYDDYPFKKKRTIQYDVTGLCTGFIDSTFTDNTFLKRRTSSFEFKKNLPILLKHANHSNDSLTGFFQYEQFKYTYFE